MENTKFTLCVLCTQLGKTFTAIQQIQTELQNDGRSIHIITTMNSLLNNEQFSSRLNHIENTYGKNSVCIFASKYTGKYKHVKKRFEPIREWGARSLKHCIVKKINLIETIIFKND